ncbi:MAG TPA: ornithine cyclodeaminase family protein [Dongiaceae bacterium]|jgi:ornithine cyclodeaminase|nr:ornithine cyclodeaminase family protein [Dongiaceae bacterium]
MLWLDAEAVQHFGEFRRLVPAIQEMNKAGTDRVERMLLSQSLPGGAQNDWLMLPAWQYDRCFGIKIANVFPGNAARNLASVQGAYLLFDGQTGETLCGMDGAMLTLRKTAANSAAAADWLARKDAETLCMVGAGALAPHLIEAHCAVRPIRQVLWWNRSRPALDRAIGELSPRLPKATIVAAGNLQDAISFADIISTATMTTEPLVKGMWLRSGTHLDLVGGYRPDMREADDDCIAFAARRYVDARFTTMEVAGDLTQPIASRLLDPASVIEMAEVARGQKPKRTSDDEITWFKSGGGGHEDLATAWAIYRAFKSE